MDAKNAKTDEFLDNRAKNRYSVQLHYDDEQRTGISSILWYEWIRDYRYSDTDYNYDTLNFTINKKWNERYSTYFGVDNILNKKIDELVLEGRLWRVGVNYTF